MTFYLYPDYPIIFSGITCLFTIRSLSKYEKRVGEKLFKSNQSSVPDPNNIEVESQEKEVSKSNVEDETKQQKSKTKSKRQYRSTPSKTKQVKSNKKNVTNVKETNKSDSTDDGNQTNPKKEPKQTVKEGVNTIVSDNVDPMEGWQLMSTQDSCKVYSKPYGESGLFQYKVIGCYENITARDFLDVQVSVLQNSNVITML